MVSELHTVVNMTVEGEGEAAAAPDNRLIAGGPGPDRRASHPEEKAGTKMTALAVGAAMGQPAERGQISWQILIDGGWTVDAEDAAHGKNWSLSRFSMMAPAVVNYSEDCALRPWSGRLRLPGSIEGHRSRRFGHLSCRRSPVKLAPSGANAVEHPKRPTCSSAGRVQGDGGRPVKEVDRR
jgi:hypothetical protein